MSTVSKKKTQVDLSEYSFSFSLSNKIARVIWNVCYWFLFRPFIFNWCRAWRNFLLRIFGAEIGANSNIHASIRIWAPWNLVVGDYSSMGPEIDCYNQGKIIVGSHTNISQKTYLCASTHDYSRSNFPLELSPVEIKDQVWIAADAFIGPGVIIGEGAVVGARAAVFKTVKDWTVVGGNPAVYIKDRKIMNS